MKTFIAVAILFSLIALPVHAELTETGLEKIRQNISRGIGKTYHGSCRHEFS